jgi:hypothetical protein
MDDEKDLLPGPRALVMTECRHGKGSFSSSYCGDEPADEPQWCILFAGGCRENLNSREQLSSSLSDEAGNTRSA